MKYIIAALLSLPVIMSGGALKDGGLPVTVADSDGTGYVIVKPDGADFSENRAAKILSDNVKKHTGATIKVVTDKQAPADGAYKPREILIGDTNRGSESMGELLYLDFQITEKDGTISIYSENSANYAAAINFITENFISDGVFEVPSGYSYIHRADYEISSVTLGGEDLFSYSVEYDDAGKNHAEKFCAELLKKTGRVCTAKEYTDDGKRKIVFGKPKAPENIYEYKVSEDNGSVFVSARLGIGLDLAYEKLTEKLFDTKGGRNVTVESISANGSIEKTDKFSDFIKTRTPLSNSRKKLLSDRTLRVAYFGGSVTDGYGATTFDIHSWRALSSKWLEETFPEAEIVHINAAIGGSGSYLGAYRTERDIISAKPDLLFIEFAINDSYTPETEQTAKENYEAIVRNVRKQLPECDIVNIYVTDSGQAASGNFVQAKAHDTVAEAYGIPSVDVGKAIVDNNGLKNSGNSKWKKYFLDGVHPVDAGYRYFADVVIEFLANEFIFAPEAEAAPHQLPEAVSPFADSELKYIIPDESYVENSKGYEFKNTGLLYLKYSTYQDYLVTSDPENSITFTFTGSDIALFCTTLMNSTASYTIDGKEYSQSFTWLNNPLILAKGLEYGEHTVTLHLDLSKCKKAEIAAFLVR